jgi:hypothetical protein
MALSGRKRFTNDLNDLKALSKKGWESHGIVITGPFFLMFILSFLLILRQDCAQETKKAPSSID